MDNRRRTIVINKKFQYQFSLLIASLAVLIANGYVIMRLLVPGAEPLALPTSVLVGLAAIEFVLVAGIWYGALMTSHRIAGPVYVIAREFARLSEGDLNARVSLRDRDMFQSEAEQINTSIIALRNRIVTIKALTQQLQVSHANRADIGLEIEKLAAELAVFTGGGAHAERTVITGGAQQPVVA